MGQNMIAVYSIGLYSLSHYKVLFNVETIS